MNISEPFIGSQVAVYAHGGAICWRGRPRSLLPYALRPQVSSRRFLRAGVPRDKSEIMASSVATPIERQFGGSRL